MKHVIALILLVVPDQGTYDDVRCMGQLKHETTKQRDISGVVWRSIVEGTGVPVYLSMLARYKSVPPYIMNLAWVSLVTTKKDVSGVRCIS